MTDFRFQILRTVYLFVNTLLLALYIKHLQKLASNPCPIVVESGFSDESIIVDILTALKGDDSRQIKQV